MILAYLAAAGLLMGMFFNSYALLGSSLLVALAFLVSGVHVGFGQAVMSMILGLISLQAGFWVGLLASALLPSSRHVTIPTSQMRD